MGSRALVFQLMSVDASLYVVLQFRLRESRTEVWACRQVQNLCSRFWHVVVVVMQNEMFLVLSLSLNFSRKLVLSL